MNELDLLKKHWKKDTDLPKFSSEEIRKIIHKKSSSVVKWIFIISMAELAIGIIFFFILNTDDKTTNEVFEKNSFLRTIDNFSYLLYIVVVYFIYKFYSMYKKISVEDSTSKLMKNILQTRKVVKHYMLFNVITFFILCITVSWILLEDKIYESQISQHHLSTMQFILIYGVMFFIISALTFIFWLFYKLIYGFFLKKLKRNYNELKSMN